MWSVGYEQAKENFTFYKPKKVCEHNTEKSAGLYCMTVNWT